jgi:hypothetical protein
MLYQRQSGQSFVRRRSCSTVSRAVVLIVTLSAGITAHASAIDFGDLPDAYFFSGGGQNIGSFYSGLAFSPNVTALSVSRFGGYADAAYPPHSGDVAIWDPYDSTISITFASPIDAFGIWYTSLDPLELDALDISGTHSIVGDPNTDGTTGTSSFLFIVEPGIETVNLTSSAGQFVLDDLLTNGDVVSDVVPEPSSLFLVAPFVSLLLSSRLRHAIFGRP